MRICGITITYLLLWLLRSLIWFCQHASTNFSIDYWLIDSFQFDVNNYWPQDKCPLRSIFAKAEKTLCIGLSRNNGGYWWGEFSVTTTLTILSCANITAANRATTPPMECPTSQIRGSTSCSRFIKCCVSLHDKRFSTARTPLATYVAC